MILDSDRTRAWWRRFDTDDLVDAEELIDFVMYHKVQASPHHSVEEKHDILDAWAIVKDVLWEK